MPQETTESLVQYNTKDFSGSRTGQNTVNIIESNLKINNNYHENSSNTLHKRKILNSSGGIKCILA